MTDAELIARQMKQLEELRDEIAKLKAQAKRAPPSFEKVTKECARCGKSVTRAPSLMKDFRYCSRACSMNRVTRKCEHCGNDFTRPASQMTESSRFCSKTCYDTAQTTGERETFMCECCGGAFARLKSWHPGKPRRFCSDKCQRIVMVLDQHTQWKGGVSIDSDGFQITYMPRDGVVAMYIRTHRKIASEAIGRLLERHEPVLRINNVVNDNRPENLFICGSVSECVRRISGSLPWPTKSNLGSYK